MAKGGKHRRHWRFYETKAGNKPAKIFLDGLPAPDAAEIVAAMRTVAGEGLTAARHLRGDIFEVRVDGENRTYRVLFSAEGKFRQVLLALEALYEEDAEEPAQDDPARRTTPIRLASPGSGQNKEQTVVGADRKSLRDQPIFDISYTIC